MTDDIEEVESGEEEKELYETLAQQLVELGRKDLATEARKLKVIRLNLIFNFVKSTLSFQWSSARNYLRFLMQLN